MKLLIGHARDQHRPRPPTAEMTVTAYLMRGSHMPVRVRAAPTKATTCCAAMCPALVAATAQTREGRGCQLHVRESDVPALERETVERLTATEWVLQP